MSWGFNPRENGMIEFVCEHGVGHYPCWYPSARHGCDGCCHRDDFPGRPPKAGDLAVCGAGRLGLILHEDKQQVVYSDGHSTMAWIGLTLPDFTPWSSRNPTILGGAREILDLDEMLPHFVERYLVEGCPWTNKPK